MGSSFSDLSGKSSRQVGDERGCGRGWSGLMGTDASVSQSAMEEAFLSTMNAGGMASRMSTIGQAVRSRYFQP